jgi:CRP/FNR family transcriptional regulator, cyclic AMP receptor protein
VIQRPIEQTPDRLSAQIAKHLPSSVIEDFSNFSIMVSHVAGSNVIRQSSSADAIFLICSGIVKIYYRMPEGNRVLLKLAGPADLVGYPTLLGLNGETLQPYDVETLTRCTLAMVSRERLVQAIHKLDQAAHTQIIESLNQTWSSLAQRLAGFIGSSFRKRLEMVFEELASTFAVEDDRGFLISLKLSHAEFAEMIGCSRPMATVLIGEMLADGSLYRQGLHQYVVPHAAMKRPFSRPNHPSLGIDSIGNGRTANFAQRA